MVFLMGKIKTIEALNKDIDRIKKSRKKIVFTNGCFDILHYGHVSYLKSAKNLGDVLIVGINTDHSVKRIKGKARPVNREKDRAKVLASLECVDYVILFGEDTPLKLIKNIKPDILVKGGDWESKDIVGGKYVLKNGGKVFSLPFIKGYSTSGLIKRLKNA